MLVVRPLIFHVPAVRMSVVPGCRIQWDLSVEGINTRSRHLVDRARAVYDSIAANNNPCWETVAKVNFVYVL